MMPEWMALWRWKSISNSKRFNQSALIKVRVGHQVISNYLMSIDWLLSVLALVFWLQGFVLQGIASLILNPTASFLAFCVLRKTFCNILQSI